MDKAKWYVLKVMSGQEKKVKNYLEAELSHEGLDDIVEQVLVPSEKIYEMRAGKKRMRERNFFPGYVLFSTKSLDGRLLHIIKEVPGTLGFLTVKGWGFSEEPAPLRDNEVNRILGKVDEVADVGEDLEKQFVVGESIKVIDGPFNSFVGKIDNVLEERKKINVIITVFGRDTPLELNYMQVEKVQ